VRAIDFAEIFPARARSTELEIHGKHYDHEVFWRGQIRAREREFRAYASEDGSRLFDIAIYPSGRVRFKNYKPHALDANPERIAFDLWLAYSENPQIDEPYNIRSRRGRRTLALEGKAVYTVRYNPGDRFGGEVEIRNLEQGYTYTLRAVE